jgi:hypothetical protein
MLEDSPEDAGVLEDGPEAAHVLPLPYTLGQSFSYMHVRSCRLYIKRINLMVL